MASTIPAAPEGYIHAGPVSDFLPPSSSSPTSAQNGDSGTDIVNGEATTCPAVSAPTTTITTPTPAKTVETTETLKASCKPQEDQLIKVIEIPQPAGRYPPQKRVAVSFFHNKWYAFINICPHQGSALSRGTMTDIEDMGIVWGAGVTCSLHDWTFDASSGQSDSTRFVIDTHDVKEIDGHIFVSQKPKNAHIAGPRRDFGGREMN
ncbi:hypothetical protein BG015_005165 [Linnemannia schmuckeri]|uniref:Rieske domain-containing protein n=1 Tax=Linnemannia schmuckeri TaxID=64567 RepID=A0A9P5S9B4_9FUNG|nr:hypothetical protein BG015_005165 [Linnemannia schmuckeri]